MNARTRPTSAQILVLSAAADRSLRRSEAGHELYKPFGTGSYSGAVIQRRTVDKCMAFGWLSLGDRDRETLSRSYTLTEAGELALGTNHPRG